ncbi:MAG: hypothetical protein K2G36_02035 [Ruminococcus sp.]|nr:hypothetical protein [Ruminococcus sp.]
MSFCPNCGKEIPDGTVCNCQSIPQAPPPKQTGFILPVVATVLAVGVIIGISSAVSGAGYKKTVKDYIKAMNKCDTKKLLSVTMPESKLKEIKKQTKDSVVDWDALLDKVDDALEDSLENLEDDYGKNVRYSIKITNKEKVKGDELDEIQEEYEEIYDAEIKKAYLLDAEVTVKGKKDEKTNDTSFYVVKVKGDNWKIYDFESGMNITDSFSSLLF